MGGLSLGMAEGEKNQDFTFKMESSSDSAVVLPSTPQASANPSSPHTNSSRKQPMSATLRERLRKTRSSFNSCYNVVKRLKVESEENDQTFSDKPASSTEENCLEFQESFKHIDSEFEENTNLKNTLKNLSVCESQSLHSGSCSALQNEFMNENLPKQRLNDEKAKLVKQVQEKEDLLRRLKLVKMYRSKVRRISGPLYHFYFYINCRKVISKIENKVCVCFFIIISNKPNIQKPGFQQL
ncbi:swi5-dependent recombination DNA repair protein 1 homolog isoform X2 [Macaca thibetana thibetana]|uniref:swi5-dependent recombination DNA repair protein 1 homolog isoform X2 n=1 Tax=Macaca thibetana thibetana TaxID=257877 RepID=UPI0021BCB35F|nr:swi5-dependent recombination DNA repair protein 1 homolog isoform X2 [Macaca thibetana thibetana]